MTRRRLCDPKVSTELSETELSSIIIIIITLLLLTIFLLVVELCLRKLHIEGDDEGTSDVDVVKVGQTFSFLPHASARFGDLVSHYVDLSINGRYRKTVQSQTAL